MKADRHLILLEIEEDEIKKQFVFYKKHGLHKRYHPLIICYSIVIYLKAHGITTTAAPSILDQHRLGNIKPEFAKLVEIVFGMDTGIYEFHDWYDNINSVHGLVARRIYNIKNKTTSDTMYQPLVKVQYNNGLVKNCNLGRYTSIFEAKHMIDAFVREANLPYRLYYPERGPEPKEGFFKQLDCKAAELWLKFLRLWELENKSEEEEKTATIMQVNEPFVDDLECISRPESASLLFSTDLDSDFLPWFFKPISPLNTDDQEEFFDLNSPLLLFPPTPSPKRLKLSR